MLLKDRADVSAHRFIPTRVGQMLSDDEARELQEGSSPRVWGRYDISSLHPYSRTVHPHACGADAPPPQPRSLQTSVHPHACGADALVADDRIHLILRFIPTRVGQIGQGEQVGVPCNRFIPTRVGQISG